nr:hypothetical protein [Tanacetum cinerariifolium]
MEWYRNLWIVLSTEDKLPFLEQPIPILPVLPEGQANPPDVVTTHQAWVKARKEIAGLMLMTMDLDIQKNLEHLGAYAKDAICHQCGKVGHWRRNCPIYLSELMKKKKLSQGASTSGIFTIELYSFPSTSWVYDKGSIEAIGDYHLCLHSGIVLILHNCHYAPLITRGIISVSRLYKDGFVNHFENDNLISVFKNNMIYFNAIPKDDIYEIVMTSSNTIKSSMYAVTNKRAKLNLDSALLWHCRLGHINKKRIAKLQHDGLLDSTDIKSFEKCVACMSGKMVRKPYSHQMERVKDLLGLIHTDVYGLFKIMSRQRAYYFVTFTDDFSSYGYVYLLKHKHEVFETFKVFQKEVENQLGKTIKSLRSDRGGYPKETMGYSFFYPSKNKVFVAQNAEFLENSLINHKASESLEDLEIIQEDDMHPSLNTGLNHEEDDQEIDEPQSDINPTCMSTKTRHPTDRLCLYVDAEEHELGDLGEPANYKAALLDQLSSTTLVVNKEFVPPLDMCSKIPWALSRINQIITWPCPKDVANYQYICIPLLRLPSGSCWNLVVGSTSYTLEICEPIGSTRVKHRPAISLAKYKIIVAPYLANSLATYAAGIKKDSRLQKVSYSKRSAGGMLTMEYLRKYEVKVTDTVEVNTMGFTILGCHPRQALNILDSYENTNDPRNRSFRCCSISKSIPQVDAKSGILRNWTVIDGDHIELADDRKKFLIERGHVLQSKGCLLSCCY